MTDHRGAYVRISGNEDDSSTHLNLDDKRAKASKFRAILHLTRQKRRAILLLGAVVLVLSSILILNHESNPETASSQDETSGHLDLDHLDYLASPLAGYQSSTINNETTYIVGKHHSVSGNFPDDYEWIDPYSKEPFVEIMYENGMNNNAMGRMPKGSPYDILVIGRGRNNRYKDPTEKISYVNLTIVGFFANFNSTKGVWERAGPEPYILELPIWRQYPRPCSNLVNGGPADPRFIWSDAGEPLAILGTASRVKSVCKAIALVDLRAVWPGLKEHLEEIGYGDIPLRFDTFTEIGKAGRKELYEKNWAPFFPGPKPAEKKLSWREGLFTSWRDRLAESTWPFFWSQVSPRVMLRVNSTLDGSSRSNDSYVMAERLDLSMGDNETLSFANSKCLTDSLPQTWKKEALHQATPFYRVTFCPRETCTPSRQNTLLLGLIHYKKARHSYRRMFVTMSVDEPFEIYSVSPPLHFGSVDIDEGVVFSVSMTFLPTKSAAELEEYEYPFKESEDTPGGYLGHGWLDDTLVVGAGLRDEVYDSIHLPVSDALRGHTLCRRHGTLEAPA